MGAKLGDSAECAGLVVGLAGRCGQGRGAEWVSNEATEMSAIGVGWMM